MNICPKQCIIKGYANVSQNKTIALDYKENNVVSKWYPWAPVPDKVLYSWKNGTDIIYTLTDELTTGPIDIFTNGTVLTRTTADAVKAGDVEMENVWYVEENNPDPVYKKQGYFDATKVVTSSYNVPYYERIGTYVTSGFEEKSRTLIWTDGDYNDYSRSHLSGVSPWTYDGKDLWTFLLNSANSQTSHITSISKTSVTVGATTSGNTSGTGYQIYYTPLVSIDHIKYDSKVWLRDETSDITIGD